MVHYQNSKLHKSSRAHELYQEWQKTKKPEDKKKLDDHMKDVDRRYKELGK
ncbi:hypothetical protein [Flavobacterium sp.]|jgi:hypothetical protein|uniref:hypothetical protein n=1 Tax=Flavobacterium sp. TaxID=239 RepID=UPI0037BEDD60